MKKFICCIILVLISAICFGQRVEKKTIIKQEYEVYGAMKQMLVPFIDKSTDLIGFARCYGDGDILLDAQYEDLYYDGSALVPVQKR